MNSPINNYEKTWLIMFGMTMLGLLAGWIALLKELFVLGALFILVPPSVMGVFTMLFKRKIF